MMLSEVSTRRFEKKNKVDDDRPRPSTDESSNSNNKDDGDHNTSNSNNVAAVDDWKTRQERAEALAQSILEPILQLQQEQEHQQDNDDNAEAKETREQQHRRLLVNQLENLISEALQKPSHPNL